MLCSKCLRGFPSYFSYQAHECAERVYRCTCSPTLLFTGERGIVDHRRRIHDDQPTMHRSLAPIQGRTRYAILPANYHKQLEAARYSRLATQHCTLPTRHEFVQFLTKYDNLRVYEWQLQEENTLRVIDSSGLASSATQQLERILSKKLRRGASFNQRFAPAALAAKAAKQGQTSSGGDLPLGPGQKRRRPTGQDREENLREY